MLGPVSLHGVRPAHLSRKPPRHRSLPSGRPAQALSRGHSRARLALDGSPTRTRRGTGASMPISLSASLATARELYVNEPLSVDLAATVYALDATIIDLCLSVFPWARYRRHDAAVKLHTQMDLRGSIPTVVQITEGKRAAVTFLDDLVLEPVAIYIMDRGHVDFARLHRFTEEAAFFVTRTKRGIRFRRRTSRLSRGAAADTLLRPGHPEAIQLSHQQLRPARADDCAALSVALGCGTLLSLDQNAPQNQSVLWHQRERGEDPDLDRSRRLRPRRHRQRSGWPATSASTNFCKS